MPADAPDGLKMAVVMPIRRPAESSSGPPELPGLMAASVWIRWSMITPLSACSERSSAEMMPVVSVQSRPNGLPIANTFCPTLRSALVPTGTGGGLLKPTPMRSTAMSCAGLTPTRPAL